MRISVIGSCSIDKFIKVNKMPIKGETILGESIKQGFGGKGANQAVALGRLGADVAMFGYVGDDEDGEKIISNLKKNNVNVEFMQKTKDEQSGMAMIHIVENDNSIIVLSGANKLVNIDYIDSVRSEILKSDIVVMQYEIPMETIGYVARLCNENNIKTVLNPAPSGELTEDILRDISYLTPNEIEFEDLCNERISGGSFEERVEYIYKAYNLNIIVTRGENGVYGIIDGKTFKICARNVDVVDTTGAGDMFNGAFVYAITNGYEIEDALNFAVKGASIAITKFGAQDGMPTLKEF